MKRNNIFLHAITNALIALKKYGLFFSIISLFYSCGFAVNKDVRGDYVKCNFPIAEIKIFSNNKSEVVGKEESEFLITEAKRNHKNQCELSIKSDLDLDLKIPLDNAKSTDPVPIKVWLTPLTPIPQSGPCRAFNSDGTVSHKSYLEMIQSFYSKELRGCNQSLQHSFKRKFQIYESDERQKETSYESNEGVS